MISPYFNFAAGLQRPAPSDTTLVLVGAATLAVVAYLAGRVAGRSAGQAEAYANVHMFGGN
jgi:hypothetical protein